MVRSFKTHTHTRTACTATGKSSVTLDTRGIQEREKRERDRDREGEGEGERKGRTPGEKTRGKQGSDTGVSRSLDYRSHQEFRLQGGRRPRRSCSNGRRQAGASCPLPLFQNRTYSKFLHHNDVYNFTLMLKITVNNHTLWPFWNIEQIETEFSTQDTPSRKTQNLA